MIFSKAIISVIRNVINFKGRASRSEYNFWMLFLFLIYSISIQLDPPSNPATNQLIEYDNNDNQVSISNEGSNPLYVPFESRFFSFVYFFYFYYQQLQLRYEDFMTLVNQVGIFFYLFL